MSKNEMMEVKNLDNEFVRMVKTYKEHGYRMVVFDAPAGDGSWLCCFDTHGESADNLPIRMFMNESMVDDFRRFTAFDGSFSEVRHMDVTDDLDEMIGNYDFTGTWYPVLNLVGECMFEWSLADNGWVDHTCSNCGFTENTDIHVSLGWNYCPNCGSKIVKRN